MSAESQDARGEREARRASDAETFSLERYVSAALDPDLSERAIYGAIVVSMLRALHALDAQTQRRILDREPPLTGKRRWDALVAASAEHFARRHGHPPAPWMNAPERFLDEPWIASDSHGYSRWEALLYCPGAFTRHGTPVHPSDLDPRGGSAAWRPDGCEATTFSETSWMDRQ